MSTTREYKDGGQSAPQWKPAVVWGANHAHGPEAAYDDDDAEAYNLHGSPEKGKCMYAVGRSVGLPRKGQVKLGDISGQVTMYSDLIVMAQRWNLLCHWATATNDWVLQCVDHTLTEPFLVSAPLLKSYEKKSVGKLSQFWLAIWILRTVGNKPQLLESMLPISTSSSWCQLPSAEPQGSRWTLLQPSQQQSVSRGHFLQLCRSKIHPQSLSLFLLKNVLFVITQFLH